MKRIVCISRR
jgi:hypothetical protein